MTRAGVVIGKIIGQHRNSSHNREEGSAKPDVPPGRNRFTRKPFLDLLYSKYDAFPPPKKQLTDSTTAAIPTREVLFKENHLQRLLDGYASGDSAAEHIEFTAALFAPAQAYLRSIKKDERQKCKRDPSYVADEGLLSEVDELLAELDAALPELVATFIDPYILLVPRSSKASHHVSIFNRITDSDWIEFVQLAQNGDISELIPYAEHLTAYILKSDRLSWESIEAQRSLDIARLLVLDGQYSRALEVCYALCGDDNASNKDLSLLEVPASISDRTALLSYLRAVRIQTDAEFYLSIPTVCVGEVARRSKSFDLLLSQGCSLVRCRSDHRDMVYARAEFLSMSLRHICRQLAIRVCISSDAAGRDSDEMIIACSLLEELESCMDPSTLKALIGESAPARVCDSDDRRVVVDTWIRCVALLRHDHGLALTALRRMKWFRFSDDPPRDGRWLSGAQHKLVAYRVLYTRALIASEAALGKAVASERVIHITQLKRLITMLVASIEPRRMYHSRQAVATLQMRLTKALFD